MTSDAALKLSESQPEPVTAVPAKLPRVWPAVVLVGLYWSCDLALVWLEAPMFTRFLSSLASVALLVLLFTIWWLTNRRIAGRDRLLGLGAAIACGIVSALLSQNAGMVAWLLMSLPWMFTTWAVWLLLARKASARTRRVGLMSALVLTWSAFLLIRFDGLTGEGKTAMHWRWTPTAEDLYRAERAQRKGDTANVPAAMQVAQPGDWTGFRGPNRDSVVRGLKIATDWKVSPRPLWRQRIGPGWSSMAVVGDRLFTQEQRDNREVIVCLNAANGHEIWAHEDTARFTDDQAGAGPRATPTFAKGRIYSLGATGILNCLDASSGERKWSRDLRTDVGAKLPIWGFSASPLIVQDKVIVFAENDGPKTLLAYRADSGEPVWTADAGKNSYSSPQRATLCGVEQILFLGGRGLLAVDPASGAVLWEHGVSAGGLPPSLQPHPLSKTQVLIASEAGGAMALDLKRNGSSWASSPRWSSQALKSSFNDFVIHDGSIYGFDGGIFCCVDVQTGERRWKDGRYGHGQVLLLADQALLLVISEKGQAILLKANPEQQEELGRFQAIEGKTWNHPAIAHRRLYVRNGEEIACYELLGE